MLGPACQDLAETKLRDSPTIPPSAALAEATAGQLWLEQYLLAQHAADLEPIRRHFLRGNDPDALLSIYKQAVAVKCRSQAPVVGASLDRAALGKLSDAMAGNKVEARFSCGGIHPYVEEVEAQGEVRWRNLLERDGTSGQLSFLGRQPLEMPPSSPTGRTLCEACRAPLCSDCAAHLERGRLPPLSHANDMWTGYGLERIYKE